MMSQLISVDMFPQTHLMHNLTFYVRKCLWKQAEKKGVGVAKESIHVEEMATLFSN